MNISDAIKSALEKYQEGNLQQAELLLEEILKIHSGNWAVLNFLGVINYQLKNYDSSIDYFRQALLFAPINADLYYNLGNSYKNKGQLDDAITSYSRALQLDPNLAHAYYNLGTVYQDKGQLDDAITSYSRALQLNPNLVHAYYNLGTVYQDKGQLDDAITSYSRALQLDPNLADTHNNLGTVYQDKGQLDDAITSYSRALQLNPNLADAYYNLGTVYQDKGQLDDAITSYSRALQLNPNLADAYCNLGATLRDKGQFDDAIKYLKAALQMNPSFFDAYYILGLALIVHGKLEEAIAAFDMALYFNPNYIKARWAKCISHLPIIYKAQSEIQFSRTRYYNELMKLRQTIKLTIKQDIKDAAEAVGNIQPFYLPYQGLNDKELQRLYGELVCKIMAARYPDYANPIDIPTLLSGESLRVGIVSGYFCLHSNWKIPIKGWIENIDKKRFDLYGYYTGKIKDRVTEDAKHSFIRFIEDIYSIEELCKIIRKDNLHLLIYPEVGMDSMVIRLAALRLAPIQCISWGHPNTSGFPTIDYFLSSDLMEPSIADEHYSEKLIRLPNLSIYYTPLDSPPANINRKAFNLREKSILYLCCQSLFKYLPRYDEIYPRIAKEVGDCQFLFISHKSSCITEQFHHRINQSFEQFGLKSNDFIVFSPQLDPSQYNALNYLSDIYLDSIDWSGCNSTFEAIAHNLPIVTLPGEFMRGRHSSAILIMMGVAETIASSLNEYVALAVRLGLDSDWRKQISDKITANKHLIYRDRTCIDGLENFLENAVKDKYC
jgi:protein O-GlcNAc transferase